MTNAIKQKTKYSGVEWIGDVPESWSIKRLKYIAKVDTGWTPPKADPENYSDSGVPWIKPDNLSGLDLLVNSEEKISFKGISTGCPLISKDDILVCCIGTVGKMGVAGCRLTFNQQINSVVFNTESIDKQFGKYLISASQEEHYRNSQIVVIGILNKTKQNNIQFPFPELLVQGQIAKYLDAKTKEVEKFVNNKKKLINLLEEQKKNVIYNTVTKGLDKNIKTKFSGIEWLGNIPNDWEVFKLKFKTKYQEGPGIMAVDFKENGVPLIRISGVKEDIVTLDGCNYLDPIKVNQKWEHFKLDIGDLVISCSASTGLVCEVDEVAKGGILYTGLIRIKVGESVDKEYLKYQIQTSFYLNQIDLLKGGSIMDHYGPSHLGKVKIICPPIITQKIIVKYLNQEIIKINKAIHTVQQEIELIEEYKKSLIYQAVTGKIETLLTNK